jgi:hypothetical protein
MMYAMKINSRIIKSFTLERSVTDYIARTRAHQSASERVNELLKRAIAQEQQEQLATEAEAFFREVGAADRAETRAFQSAAARTLARDED